MIVAIGFAALFASCSDGEMKLAPAPVITAPEPVVISFIATPDTIKPGEATELSYKVEGATKIEIASAPDAKFQFHAEFEELEGSTKVTDMTSTTTFILTASNTIMVPEGSVNADENTPAEDGEEKKDAVNLGKMGQIPDELLLPEPNLVPTTATVTATITVTVLQSGEVTADITAEKTAINLGESTIIRWVVTPDTASASVRGVSGSDSLDIEAEEGCMGDAVTEGVIAGCSTVTPTETTTYTVEGTTDNGGHASASVTVEVINNLSATIKAEGEEGTHEVTNFGMMIISYVVSPKEALATVTADKTVECTPPLPENADLSGSDGMGETQCVVNENTRFTLTATLGDREATSTVLVTLRMGQIADAQFTADPWAFEGEKVTVVVDPDVVPGSARGAISEIKIGGTSHQLPATGKLTVNDIIMPKEGLDASVVCTGGAEVKHPKIVQAVNPIAYHLGEDVAEISKIFLDEEDPTQALVGVRKNEYTTIKKDGKDVGAVSVFKVDVDDGKIFAEWDVDFSNDVLKYAGSGNTFKDGGTSFFNMINTFPARAIAMDKANNIAFVGTTGAVKYSKDDGATWGLVTMMIRPQLDDYESCGGDIVPGNGAEFGSLGQGCDILVDGSHLIVATDIGTLTYTDISQYIANPSWDYINGVPRQEGQIDRTAYPIYGFPTHDLDIANGKIYAATDRGLYVSSDSGETWAQMDGISDRVFAVKVDDVGNKLYIGTAEAIKYRDLGAAIGTWETKAIPAKVYSLDTDPYRAGVILAGTAGGLYVSRDSGTSWTLVSSAGFQDVPVKTVAIGAKDMGNDVLQYIISYGGDKSAAIANLVIGGIVAPIEETPQEPGDENTPPEDNGDVTVQENTTVPDQDLTPLPQDGGEVVD